MVKNVFKKNIGTIVFISFAFLFSVMWQKVTASTAYTFNLSDQFSSDIDQGSSVTKTFTDGTASFQLTLSAGSNAKIDYTTDKLFKIATGGYLRYYSPNSNVKIVSIKCGSCTRVNGGAVTSSTGSYALTSGTTYIWNATNGSGVNDVTFTVENWSESKYSDSKSKVTLGDNITIYYTTSETGDAVASMTIDSTEISAYVNQKSITTYPKVAIKDASGNTLSGFTLNYFVYGSTVTDATTSTTDATTGTVVSRTTTDGNYLTVGNVAGDVIIQVTGTKTGYSSVYKTYTLHVLKYTPKIVFATTTAKAETNSSYTPTFTLNDVNGTDIKSNFTQAWTLSGLSGTTINASTGVVTTGSTEGTATITLNLTPGSTLTNTYNTTSASYTLSTTASTTKATVTPFTATTSSSYSNSYTQYTKNSTFDFYLDINKNISSTDITVSFGTVGILSLSSVTAVGTTDNTTTLKYTFTMAAAGTTTVKFAYAGNSSYLTASYTTGTFTILGNYAYIVGTDQSTTASTTFRKYVITQAGSITGGSTVSDVPGVTMTFGNSNQSDWVAKMPSSGYKNTLITYESDIPVTSKSNGIPSNGTYYAFTPSVNGFLTIDGSFYARHEIVLVSSVETVNGASIQYKDTLTFSQASYGEHQFKHVLMKGFTYYLYDQGFSSNVYSFQLHGFSYKPAFVIDGTAQEASTTAAVYKNGSNENTTPWLARDASNTHVTYSSSNTGVATISSSELLTLVAAGTTTIQAIVSGSFNNVTISDTAQYVLTVNTVPAYIVASGFTPEIGSKVFSTSTNDNLKGPEGITMTFGGLSSYKNSKNESVTDSYNSSSMDAIGSNNRTLDGFMYATRGSLDAKDEKGTDYNQGSSEKMFELPCRGTYLKFEPTTNGTLTVYLLQNGIVDYDADDNVTSTTVSWRPYYIVDEKGDTVTLNEEPYTIGTLRASINETTFSYSDSALNYKTIIDNAWKKWNKGDKESVVCSGKGGHIVISKAYVRYIFNVVAGKTYFIFSNNSKLGLAGFTYLKNSTSNGTVNLSETEAYTPEEKQNVTVNLTKTMHCGVWNDLCVPFSIPEDQFEAQFGSDAYVVDYDYLNTTNNRLHFTIHYYKFVRAGRPCFVYVPGTAGESKTNFTFTNVSIVANAPTTLTGKDNLYTLNGSYSPIAKVPTNGYWLGYNATSKVVKFLRIAEGITRPLNGFRCYYTFNSASAAKADNYIIAGDEEDEATGINDIKDVPENLSGDVFTVAGQKIRSHATTLEGLQQGLYLWNGKIYIVK